MYCLIRIKKETREKLKSIGIKASYDEIITKLIEERTEKAFERAFESLWETKELTETEKVIKEFLDKTLYRCVNDKNYIKKLETKVFKFIKEANGDIEKLKLLTGYKDVVKTKLSTVAESDLPERDTTELESATRSKAPEGMEKRAE